HTIDLKGGKRLEIGLNPSPSAGIRTSYREGFGKHSPSLSPIYHWRSHLQITHRCQGPQAFDFFHHRLNNGIDLLLSRAAPQPKTNRGAGQGVIYAQSTQHVRRLGRARRAGRAGGERHNVLQADQERLALHRSKTQVEVPRQALFRMRVEVNIVKALSQSGVKPLPQIAQAHALLWPQVLAQFTRFAKAHNAWDIQRPRAESSLLPTAIDQGPQPDTPGARFTHIQGPHSLWTVDLMPGERHEVDVQVVDIAGDLAYPLHGITVKQDAV